MRFLLLLISLLGAAEWTLAQSRSRPDPTDPSAPASVLRYQSSFRDYQPFQEQKKDWKQANQEVAEQPAMGSMQHKPGATMPGMAKPSAGAPKSGQAAAGHDMGSMQHKPGTSMDMHAPTAPVRKEDHTMAMAKPRAAPERPNNAQPARITGTATVQLVDKANGRVKLTHDPIAAMGWPAMTLFFRLRERSLADQLKEGDKVEFLLEKSGTGYVISGIKPHH